MDELKKLIDALGKEVKSLDGKRVAEIKGLTDQLTALQADLAEERKALAGESKDLTDNLAERLNGFERKLNEFGVKSNDKQVDDAPKSFAEVKSLDEKMKASENLEIKDFPRELIAQDIIIDNRVVGDYPVLAQCKIRPTKADLPKMGFSTASTVQIKGVDPAPKSTAWKHKEIRVEDYQYQPTLSRDDVKDAGAMLMDEEVVNFKDAVGERLEKRIIQRITAAKKATVANASDDVQEIKTAEANKWSEEDVRSLVRSLKRKFRKKAVILANGEMAATLQGIKATDGRSLWVNSMRDGTPDRLIGRPFIESEDVPDNTVIIASLQRGVGVVNREEATLDNIERSGGDYKPYFIARKGVGILDAEAIKVMIVKTA